MKKLIFSLLFVLIGLATFAQLGGYLTVKKANSLYPQIDQGFQLKDTFNTKAEVTTLLATKSALTGSVHKVVVSNVQLNNTGNTNENIVLTATIPANSIGTNGSFHITMLIGQTNSANSKTIKVKFNGTQVCQAGVTSCACYQAYSIIRNRNSLSSQVAMYAASAASGAFVSGTSGTISTFTIDTASPITVTVTIQNANGTETASLEAFEILAVQ